LYTSVHVEDFANSTFSAVKLPLDEVDIISTEAPILVIDGATEKFKTAVGHGAVWWSRGKPLIIVSSLQFDWGAEDYIGLNMDEICLPGWSLQEYEVACADDQFYASIRANLDADSTATSKQEQIKAKHFIAGASARWMFALNTEQAKQDALRYKLSRFS
jgi:hypothetical protein